MGDRRKQALRLQFDGKLRLEFHGARITGDAGLLAVREMDEAFRLTETAAAMLAEPRAGQSRPVSACVRAIGSRKIVGQDPVNGKTRIIVRYAPHAGSEGRPVCASRPEVDPCVAFFAVPPCS